MAVQQVTTRLIADSAITNAKVAAGAGIVYSKLDLANSIVNADISTTAAIAYSKLSLANSVVDADVNAAAAIAYSKLNLSDSIVNADISTTAAVAYSKLSLTNSIVDADINASADISTSKLSLSGDFRHPVPTELINYDPAANALVQDLSTDIIAAASTGPTVKGVVVLEADNNFVPRGVKNEFSWDDILSGELDATLSGADANQSAYMRITNSYVTAQPTNITGVQVGYVEQGNTGGSLSYTTATTELQWKTGAAQDVSGGGLFILDDGAGNRIVVEVVPGSLPGTDQNDTLAFSTGYRGGLFYRSSVDGSEVPLKTPASFPEPWRVSYAQIYGIDDLPFLAFFGVGNASEGVISSHTHVLSHITDVTATASEINQALDGISANVTFTNLNTLTGGGNADALHTHAGLGSDSWAIEVFVATAAQTDFILGNTPISNSEQVTIEGVKQAKTVHYTISGTTVTLNEGAQVGERIIVQYAY